MESSHPDLELQTRRLRWRSRRGMKELDVLLERYLENGFAAAGLSEREAFEALLELQDPELLAFFTGRDQPKDPALRGLITRICQPD